MALLRPTELHRVLVDETGRCFVDGGPEPLQYVVPPAEDGVAVRLVRIYLPSDPPVSLALDKRIEDVGFARPKHWPEPETGSWLRFRLLPEQFVSAVSHRGYALLTVVVEYPEGDVGGGEIR